jgi:hypothetical protein
MVSERCSARWRILSRLSQVLIKIAALNPADAFLAQAQLIRHCPISSGVTGGRRVAVGPGLSIGVGETVGILRCDVGVGRGERWQRK